MRKNLFLVMALFTALCMSANAEIFVEEQTGSEYLINNGYSEVTAEEVLIMKNRISGAPCEPLYEKNNNKVVRILKKFHAYLDPSIDEEFRYHHDIKISPSYSDL